MHNWGTVRAPPPSTPSPMLKPQCFSPPPPQTPHLAGAVQAVQVRDDLGAAPQVKHPVLCEAGVEVGEAPGEREACTAVMVEAERERGTEQKR